MKSKMKKILILFLIIISTLGCNKKQNKLPGYKIKVEFTKTSTTPTNVLFFKYNTLAKTKMEIGSAFKPIEDFITDLSDKIEPGDILYIIIHSSEEYGVISGALFISYQGVIQRKLHFKVKSGKTYKNKYWFIKITLKDN